MNFTPERPSGFPKKLKEGSVEATIYWQANPSRRRNPVTKVWEPTGTVHDEYVLAYYFGTRQISEPGTKRVRAVPRLVRRKFSKYAEAEREARFVLAKLANAEGEILKLTGLDRAAYVQAMQRLREWRSDADLNLAVADYVTAVRRLPEGVNLQAVVDGFLQRHPSGVPRKTVAEVVGELIAAKQAAGRGAEYVAELNSRLRRFADSFAVPVTSVTGGQINDWIASLGLSGRTQLNFRRVIGTLFKFAKRRGYLPKDWDEMGAVERPDDDSGEIGIFTPDELRRLFAACMAPVVERGVERTRRDMVPYLAVAAFAGLRAAEIKRLDWSEVHLAGDEKFIEVKASKSKTASRRLVPIVPSLAVWLMPFAQSSGPLVPVERVDKQLFERLAPKAGVPWKRNALRHSFISYRLALIKDAGQVSLEAGNSAQMVFRHYRQLVTETLAKEWFSVVPPKSAGADIITLPARDSTLADSGNHDQLQTAAR